MSSVHLSAFAMQVALHFGPDDECFYGYRVTYSASAWNSLDSSKPNRSREPHVNIFLPTISAEN
jgi:hypothetical protein